MNWCKIIAVLIIIFIISIIVLYNYSISSPNRISSKLGKILLKNNKIDIVLDVRTKIERDSVGFYPGSIHIPASDLETEFVNKYPNKNIFILAYCNTGQRARKAVEKLEKLGYMNVMYITGYYKELLD
jgi:rhodanese-related sulfurtransferase